MTQQFSLPAELTIYTVAALKPQWLEHLDGDARSALRVDAAAVVDLDAAGVQLLLALANALQNRQRRLQLVDPSEALHSACAALGAARLLAAEPGLEGAGA